MVVGVIFDRRTGIADFFVAGESTTLQAQLIVCASAIYDTVAALARGGRKLVVLTTALVVSVVRLVRKDAYK